MEQEQVVRAYDPTIMKRLLGFLKPHAGITSVAVFALIVSTAAELLLPVILQRTLDESILISHYRVAPGAETALFLEEPGLRNKAVETSGVYYIPGAALSRLDGTERKDLVSKGLLSAEEYFLFPVTGDEALRNTLERRKDLISSGGRYGVIPKRALTELSPDELRAVRSPYVSRIDRAATLVFALLVSSMIFTFLQNFLISLAGQRVMKDLRTKLFGHVLNQSLGHLSRHPVGRIVTRATNDVETVNELFTNVAMSFLKDASLMIGIVATIFLLNVRLGFIAVATLPPVFAVTAVFRTKAREAYRAVRLRVSAVNAFISEHLSGVQVVQTFVREAAGAAAFSKKSRDLMKANLGEMYVMATFRPVVDFLSTLSLAVVVYVGSSLLLDGLLSMGVLIAFLDLTRRFYQPVMDVSDKFTVMQSAMAGGERVFALLDEEERIPDTGTVPLPSPLRGEIVFEHVSFSYREGEPVLRDLSFRVEPGETVAVVGYTGAGKTTVANLLTRMWDIDSGRILLDGIDIRELPLDSLRRAVVPVQQDVFVFTGTIGDNISLGSGLPPERIREAAVAVQADVFISRLAQGYDTPLSEGGTNISTGQRQLLSFARVIAHDPGIVIMDEATGNVDTETETLIRKGIERLLRGRTSIVIAHRLSTISHADRILVLSDGRLVEEGGHGKLLGKKGIYWNLYRLQFEQGDARTVN